MARVRATFSQEVAKAVNTIEEVYSYVINKHISSYKEDSYVDNTIRVCFNVFKQHYRQGLVDSYMHEFDVAFNANKQWHLEHDFEQKVKRFILDNLDKKIVVEFKKGYYRNEEDHFYIEYAKDVVFNESSIGLVIGVPHSWQCAIKCCIKRVYVLVVENEEEED